jgi:hypothetical protein
MMIIRTGHQPFQANAETRTIPLNISTNEWKKLVCHPDGYQPPQDYSNSSLAHSSRNKTEVLFLTSTKSVIKFR